MKEENAAGKTYRERQKSSGKNQGLSGRVFYFTCGQFFLLCLIALLGWLNPGSSQKVSAEDGQNEIENALFARQEFFGTEAIVPLPVAEARENLAKLAENFPANPQILAKLAELDEKLSRFDEAEANLGRLAEIDASKLEDLAAFYHRHARFEKEAELLKKMLFSIGIDKRAEVFERLIYLARIHDLQEYLQPEFYTAVAKENGDVFGVFQTLIEKLAEEKNYAEALKFLRQAKQQFPENKNVLLDREIEILRETNESKEAETIYKAAFDPFWPSEEAEKFYQFLDDADQLRLYGAEMKARFNKNPADFDAAIRFALYQEHDYNYRNDGEIASVILKLERAKKDWTTKELVTVTRLLLQENEGRAASRFLYTLYLREDFQKNSELRAKILYQIFEMFSDAENQKLPLTKGDLRFYKDIAGADTNPGITTGILSLIFSDADPRGNLEEQETAATKSFNRAAAYRVFEEYKKEFPSVSPELAQMYLDIVRLYTATGETDIAEKTLSEFAERFENASDYPAVALKLADAFAAASQPEKEREIYQKILDYLGRQGKSLTPLKASDSSLSNTPGKETFEISSDRNDGINIPKPEDQLQTYDNSYSEDQPAGIFRDYLERKTVAVTYVEVLDKFVASFAKEKKTPEILALYSGEIAKYPDEEWLYERRLTWLEQTNLISEQLRVYQTAMERFPSHGWQDKLARWFLREKRQDDFAAFSGDLVGKLNDAEIQKYLSEFIDTKVSTSEFERQLYLKLYQTTLTRFPHNMVFVQGLLRFYKTNKQNEEWRKLAAEYFFESKEIRDAFIDDLAEKGEIRNYLQKASGENSIYELFRADACVRLSDYENAVAAYRKLNELYPDTLEFTERLINLTRSLGQKNRELLTEAAAVSTAQSEFYQSSAEYRTRSGEIYAELGNYENAGAEWEKLIATARGDKEIYLDTATVYWDYFQYEKAFRTIKNLRGKFGDETLYAFEAGAILDSQHKRAEAISEYVKALGENEETYYKVRYRLLTLTEKPDVFAEVQAEVERQSARRSDAGWMALSYAKFGEDLQSCAVEHTVELKREIKEKTGAVLLKAVSRSSEEEFLKATRDFYDAQNNLRDEQLVLRRLADVSKNPRQKISYRLQLAESFEKNKDRDAAKEILNQLVNEFPTNFGVLTEASDFYSHLGFSSEAVEVLQKALPQSRGVYRVTLAQKLSKRLIQIDKLAAAETVLEKLHDEDKEDAEIFRSLANVLVRTKKPELMRKAFDETVTALRQSDADRRELDDRIAGLRVSMIDAFTRLQDYDSAIAQHIEIINREPENEELVENAVSYARRYGGAETLINYYRRLSAEAFKNYRWNVVLAQLYEANKDPEKALQNYRAAIVNQPEMPELYLSIADIETRRGNFDEALKNLDTVLELTNDGPEYVKRKIEILKKAGRFKEIEAEQAKLPFEEERKITVNEFSEAQKLQNTEREKARQLYREAFGKLLENPVGNELKAANIVGYVQSVREEEPLNQINERLWTLREKLIAIADKSDSTDAGEARKRLSTLDGALTEAVGMTAKNFAVDEELAGLHEYLSRKIEETSIDSDNHQTLALIQDLSRRAGLGDLEERILIRKLEDENSSTDQPVRLLNLINFYNERGAYQKSFDILEKYGSDQFSLKAEAARLAGNKEKELEALRAVYWKDADKLKSPADADVERYLEVLYAENRDELNSLTGKSSAYQLQLINFLLGKGERELAHAAINSANLSQAWKNARNAETSLALKETDENSARNFEEALQLAPIGELINQKPDKDRFLSGDDWFRLTSEYGEWLDEQNRSQANTDEQRISESNKYLRAMTENQPLNADAQTKLAAFYLERNETEKAIEHFRLALEIKPGDAGILTDLGATYYAAGDKNSAKEIWNEIIEDASIEIGLIYFQTLEKYDLTEKAREDLPPVIVEFLQDNNADQSEDFQNLIRAVAGSFTTEAEKSAYFQQILILRPTDTSLAEMLLNENLIDKQHSDFFYERLIGAKDLDIDAYDFASVLERVWSYEDAESVYEQENDYKTEERENEGFEWRRKYLESLIERGENAKAGQLVAKIEKALNNRAPSPVWLRLEKIRLQIRAGNPDVSEAERFIGIIVPDAVSEVKPPSVERFNDVLRVLKDEKAEAGSAAISESYFARMLALKQFDASNFVGLARTFFQKGEPEKALRILQVMTDAGGEETSETALAEISSLEIVKAQAVDAAKLAAVEEKASINQTDALRLAAETSLEFGCIDPAIAFRRRLLEINPTDSGNKITLAEILSEDNHKDEAVQLLTQIAGDRNVLRSQRWQARMFLNGADKNAETPDVSFDPFSQFYGGILAAQNGRNEIAAKFFINSLIADTGAELSARQELVKIYMLSDKPLAALRIAETDKAAKSDDILELLSNAAEKLSDWPKAIEFEKAKSNGGNVERLLYLQKTADEKSRKATYFTVDFENTRKL